jgi:hypothetical protein
MSGIKCNMIVIFGLGEGGGNFSAIYGEDKLHFDKIMFNTFFFGHTYKQPPRRFEN